MTLIDLIKAELAADGPEFRTIRRHSWNETWMHCTRGRISYRLEVREGGSIPTNLVLSIRGLPDLHCTLDVPIKAHGYAGWARMGDKQVARRVVGLVNQVVDGVGTSMVRERSVDDFRLMVAEKSGEVDPNGEADWADLALGFFLAHGHGRDAALELVDEARLAGLL